MTDSDTADDWAATDSYLAELLVGDDPALTAALEANAAAGLPPIDVAPVQGKLLHLLARIRGARRILEIGTLGGYSTIWLARAVGDDGRVVTLEYEPRHAEVARANLDRAGVGERVEVRVGAALDLLPSLEVEAPFDLVFVDADKENNPHYVRWALRLGRPGTVIVVDNVIRGGSVTNADLDDERVRGAREVLELMGADPRLDATALQTVGVKGWDGVAIAVMTG
ncbi:methyltransferase [Rhodococcus ruber Chol-4]|jgi:predicted O-methyltransferase YrrM|uniref:Methyltransferase n=1 Tax=Rhodococcus ruber TaxID=1830 RepID=A0A098BJ22_9NOCA|nr:MULTISPECIES: O-methyltransferase [Rhodococcus]MDO2379165.1 O-methyltransferase [Rhodococcus ruber]RIK05738.1 MAG: O-methyltransferase [Acidobacteriota bacterium]AUM15523.1 O-methyltransferase [Rhodococcus ruber]AXY51898.1 O-methyltransferase [Rhodococcus ruber]KXF86360.1 methyltransferase [Rhodococcus ruber Chol-4]